MIDARLEGKTLEQVGSQFGLTRERVRQLLAKHGGPTRSEVGELRARRNLERANADTSKIREILEKAGPMSLADVATATGIAPEHVLGLWPAELERMRLRPVSWIASVWSDEEILRAIVDASTYEFPLTSSAYKELVRVGQVDGPSLPRVTQRFGTWATACDAAGVEHGQTMRSYQSKWADQDLLDYAREFFLSPGKAKSPGAYTEWKKVHAPDGPSGMTLRNRFGSWTTIKVRALSDSTEENE